MQTKGYATEQKQSAGSILRSASALFLLLLVAMPVLAQPRGEANVDATAAVTGTPELTLVEAPVVGTGFPALETYTPAGRPFRSLLRDESRVASVMASAWLEMFGPSDYLRLRPFAKRTLHVDPFPGVSASPTDIDPLTVTGAAGAPSSERVWTSDRPLEEIVAWYSDRHDLDFTTYRRPISGRDETLVLAQSTGRIGDAVVSLYVWTPTLSSKGRTMKGADPESTTILVQERSFRHRSDLVAEGTDALVELTWNVPYDNLIKSASMRYQVDPFLIAALVQQESGFNPHAISVDSAMGLTQMIPTTAAMLGVTDPFDPSQAINGGTKYLKMMLRRYRGNVEFALAAYNAGPGAVDRYKGVPPYRETRDYVRRIMSRWRQKSMGRHAEATG